MTRLLLILAASIAFNVTPSYGAWMSGNDLLRFCEPAINYEAGRALSADDKVMFGMCAGYIEGWLDSNQYYGKFPPQDVDLPSNVCIPEEVETGQIISMVFQYLQENPTKREIGASNLVLLALQGFACTETE